MLSRREFIACGFGSAAAVALPKWPQAGAGGKVFDRLLKTARQHDWRSMPIAEAAAQCGIALIDTPYVAATLEVDDDLETCVVNLDGLDCVTFYEAAFGFARMLHSRGKTAVDLTRSITEMRYRGGRIDGYLSRLHYTSDWFFDNAKRGIVADLTPSLPGAVRMHKPIDFMSHHPDSYRQLRAHPEWIKPLSRIEQAITERKPWYVPNEKVKAIEPLLRSGDIVGIATRMEGLDCSHTGMIYVDEQGVRRFLNASSVAKKVVLGERLSEYALKYSRNLGVMIARP